MAFFSDELRITTASGSGGGGCVSFRREKYVPRGGPDGGDGGRGGDVVFVVDPSLRTLVHLRPNAIYAAKPGRPGEGRKKFGKNGEDVIIEVPVGTIVKDAHTGEVIRDLTVAGERWVMLEGGLGGKGNWHYKTSVRQAPRYAQPGIPGQTRDIKLELSIIADVGFVGFPSAGKSSLLNSCTNARSKVAAYPFTTKIPHLGVLRAWDRDIILADIPGIIEGASEGAGLGFRFLKHIARTAVLAFLIDMGENPEGKLRQLRAELDNFSPELTLKKWVLVPSKMDMPDAQEHLEMLKEELVGLVPEDEMPEIYPMSTFTGEGLDALKEAFFKLSLVDAQPEDM